jgi:hypothetical protein
MDTIATISVPVFGTLPDQMPDQTSQAATGRPSRTVQSLRVRDTGERDLAMITSWFGRSVLCAGLTIIMLAGCGGQSGTPGTMPQGATMAARAHQASGSSGDLVYVITAKGIVIVSYPSWAIVAKIPGYRVWYSVCSDPNNGSVFAIDGDHNVIDEYAHGGTTAIATLTPPSGYAQACAVDPTTGNLAVVILEGASSPGEVLVYPGATGTPTAYVDSKVPALIYPAYDNAGNLFIAAENRAGTARIGELRVGHKQFTIITPNENMYAREIQWDGTYLVFQTANGPPLGSTIYQLAISGKTATVVNTVQLTHCNTDYFWIYNGSLLSFYYPPKANNNEAIAVWPYPAGGNPTSKFYGLTKGDKDYIYDLAVSVAPPGSRIHK